MRAGQGEECGEDSPFRGGAIAILPSCLLVADQEVMTPDLKDIGLPWLEQVE